MSYYNNNPSIRSKAASVVRSNLTSLIVIFLISNIISSTVSSVIGFAAMAVCFGPAFVSLMQNIAYYEAYPEALLEELLGSFSPLMALLPILLLAVGVFTISLQFGSIKAHIDMSRGERAGLETLFCRIRNMLGCFGLMLWVELKLLAWMLPGLGLLIAGAILMVVSAAMDTMALVTLGIILLIVGYILMFVLMLPASFRYAMSTYIYADDPSVGVFAAVEESKHMMKGRKFQYFKLTIPYVLILLVIMLGLMVLLTLSAFASEILAVLVGLAGFVAVLIATVYISFLSSMAGCCFYTEYRG